MTPTACCRGARVITLIITAPLLIVMLIIGFVVIYSKVDVNCDKCDYIDCIPQLFGEWCGGYASEATSTSG